MNRKLVGVGLTAAVLSPFVVHQSGRVYPETASTAMKTIDTLGEGETVLGNLVLDGSTELSCMAVGKFCRDSAPSLAAKPKPAPSVALRPAGPNVPTETSTLPAAVSVAECISHHMTVQERLGQMIMIGVDSNDPNASVSLFKKYHIGGAILMGQVSNPDNGEIQTFKQNTGTLIATDEEGGVVQRFSSLGALPPPAEVVASQTPGQARDMIKRHAEKMNQVGIDMVFGPLLDVGPKSGKIALGNRVFSREPGQVEQYGRAYIQGWKAGGITPVAKHFPGMGPASGNTDYEPAITSPIDELRTRDLLPYENMINNGMTGAAIMVGNQEVPSLSPNTPASMSRTVVNGELRGRLGFDGLTITDSLSAKAIPGKLSTAVKASLMADVDIALIVDPPAGISWDAQLKAIQNKLINAYRSGELPEAQINTSVARILAAKHNANPCA